MGSDSSFRRSQMMLLLQPLLCAAVLLAEAQQHAPRSYYRFEDASDLMRDSAPAALHLEPTGDATPVARTQAEGGIVGSWLQLQACGDAGNRSLAANASQLPRQCTGLGRYCNPNYGCPGQPPLRPGGLPGKKGGCCCNSTADPHGKLTGITVEFLIKLGRCAKLNGNLTLFDTGGGRYGGGANARIWIDLSRFGLSVNIAANGGDKVGTLMLATANGTGRASTQYLHDDEWHHVVIRRSTGGLTGPGKLDAWVDGQVPLSPDPWFSRSGTPTPSWPWAVSNPKPGGYFGQWADGVWPNLMMLPSAFDGGIDEVALYEEALPDELIVQHYSDAMSHQPYSSTVSPSARAVPPPADPAPQYDLQEYAPGTLLPTPEVTGCGLPHCVEQPTPGVKLSPLAQLQSFPLPRYHSQAAGKWALQKLGNCMNSQYLGGENQANTSVINMPCYISCNETTHICNGTASDCVVNATNKIKMELGSRWGYLLNLGNIGCRNTSDPHCGWIKPPAAPGARSPTPISETMTTIEMVNENDFGFEYDLTRQNNHDMQIGSLSDSATSNCNGNQSLPKSCYMQNASGHFIGFTGAGANCTGAGCTYKCKQPRLLVSDAAREKYCPDSLFAVEAAPFRATIAALTKLLDKPIVRVWNDGEQFNVHGNHIGNEMDPVMLEDYEASGITSRFGPDCFVPAGQAYENATLCKDWFAHVSAWRAGYAGRWRDAILQDTPTTKYGEYEVAGTEGGTGNWTFMREIMTPESVDHVRTGRWGAMRYSKASIYPGASGPGGWATGWMGGLDVLELYRPSEIKAGDELFSPFVAAGWKSAVERNMRPAQWLGFLKLMTALGAEYVETGFFSPLQFSAKVKNVQLPQNYVWQAAAPAYAQATLSLWSDLLFEGHLVDTPPASGGMPSPPLSQNCGYEFCDKQSKNPGQSWWYPELLLQYWPEPKTYRFWAGHGQDLVVIVRKHEAREQFVIVGSIQPQSNLVGNAPLNVTASILLEGRQLNFTVRRQGSVYLYEPASAPDDDAATTRAAPPSFVQLDGWHEHTHFSWWSDDFTIEAELHDAFLSADATSRILPDERNNRRVYTEIAGWQAGDTGHDFTQARSFVSVGGRGSSSSFGYEVEPRPVNRGVFEEVTANIRGYRVAVTMRVAASEWPSITSSGGSEACVTVRYGGNGTTAGEVIGEACVDSDDRAFGSPWRSMDLELEGAAALLRLEAARAHRLVLSGPADAAVQVDKLQLVQV